MLFGPFRFKMGKKKRLQKSFVLAEHPGDLSCLLYRDQTLSHTATRKAVAVTMAAIISQALSIFLALYQVAIQEFSYFILVTLLWSGRQPYKDYKPAQEFR